MTEVDVEALKAELTHYLNDICDVDELMLEDVLAYIDKHTKSAKSTCGNQLLDQSLNEGDGVYRP